MAKVSTKPAASSMEDAHFLCNDWFDPLENEVRTRIRGLIEDVLEAELEAALGGRDMSVQGCSVLDTLRVRARFLSISAKSGNSAICPAK